MIHDFIVPDIDMNLVHKNEYVPDIENDDDLWKLEHAFVSIFFNGIDVDSKIYQLSIVYCRGNYALRDLIKNWLITNRHSILNIYSNICHYIPLSEDELIDEENNYFFLNSRENTENETEEAINYLRRFSFFQN